MLRHLPFFEALVGLEEGSPEWQATTAGLAVLRLVDSGIAEGPEWLAAHRLSVHVARLAVEAMPPGGPARGVLGGLLEALTAGGMPDVNLLAARLFAYGRVLDLDARYALAADVYATVAHYTDAELHADLVIDAYMRLGYCRRMLGAFDEAGAAYDAAKRLAETSGDQVKLLRGRVADGNLAIARGNLPAAAAILDEVIADAEGEGLREVRVVALHDRAAVAYRSGEYVESAQLVYQALEQTQAPLARDRLLSDLAAVFIQLGVRSAARDALLVLAATAQEQYTRWVAEINLLELAALDGAELLFEQHRRRLATATLPVDLEADFLLTSGQGLRRMGRLSPARQALERALAVATRHQLHQRRFQAEQALDELARGERLAARETAAAPLALQSIALAVSGMRETTGVT